MRVMRRVAPGSSKGRTTGFGPVNGGSNPPPGTTEIMRIALPYLAFLLISCAVACQKGDGARDAASAKDDTASGLGCDHDEKSRAVVKHSWPYPAEHRDLRWTGQYEKVKLKLRPNQAAFVTATISFQEGDHLEVLDSEVHVTKPRRLIAKRDIFTTRKVVSQGIEVEREYLVTKAGEPASFLFYNSRGQCMVQADGGPSWTPCTFEDTFEGLSADDANACEQTWWIQVQRNKVDRGWLIVNPQLTESVGPPPGEAR